MSSSIFRATFSKETVVIDGLPYKVVKIGNQKWMAENLEASFEQSTGVRHGMFYELDEAKYGRKGKNYGRLYFWEEAVEVANMIEGWHLPTVEDFEELKEFVGENSGTKLKSVKDWDDASGTNSFGFNALPAGNWFNSEYQWVSQSCGFWTADTEASSDVNAYYYRLQSSSIPESEPTELEKTISIKEYSAFSLRLIKD